MSEPAVDRARYIMIGGFLGAGKTTAVAALARRLTAAGRRVGLITNDQSTSLVDTAMLKSKGFAVEEIAGGCFCCRFDSLSDAAEKLTREKRPDIFIAEPVGSCTDLIATVSYPLRRIYGDRFLIAPLSVLVDPIRAARILGLDEGRSFSSKVAYVYRKQLEEADLIVINKSDSVEPDRIQALKEKLESEFPRAQVLSASVRDETGVDAWFETLQTDECPEVRTMSVDYQTYAEGEALLGWLNCTVKLTTDEPVDGNQLLLDLAAGIGRRLDGQDLEIAHLKMTLDSPDDAGNLSVVSLVGSGTEPDLRESLLDEVNGGTLIVNLRAEADPELLIQVTMNTLDELAEGGGFTLTMEHSEHFRPGKPVPTHRDSVSA